MTSRFLTGMLIVLLLTLGSSASGAKNPRPNVIIIYLDDMGFGDLSLTGATGYHTPNIDMLAADGIFFTHYLAPQAVSSASRAGLMTGCYPNRIGFSGALDHASKTGIN